MAATFQWNQRVGSSASVTTTDLGVSGNLFNFKSSDDVSAANYTANPVTAGNASYEVWLRAHFTGTFNQIQNVQFWKSSGTLGTGEAIKWDDGGNATYGTPTSATSGKATTTIPTADPGSSNVSINSSQSSSLSAAGFSDYIVLQLQTTTAAEAGDTESFTFTLQYDEN